jgi:hypothetical protein
MVPGNRSHSTLQKGTVVLDILSIGSLTRLEYLQAQQETFGSHFSVRNFFNVTEEDDTDRQCQSTLTTEDLSQIRRFCQEHHTELSKYILPQKLLKEKANPVGWLCAQTRPAIGLHKVLQHYKTQEMPDYLIIMDDDTYFNVEFFLHYMNQQNHSSLSSFAMAGCMVPFPPFSFPHGGFGFMMSKAFLEKIMLSLTSVKTIPDRLHERRLFQPGMNVVDLIYAYATDQPFSNYRNWTDGFCAHSDW